MYIIHLYPNNYSLNQFTGKAYIGEETRKLIENLYLNSIHALSDAIKAFQRNNDKLASKVIASKKAYRRNSTEIKERLAERLSKRDKNRISIIRFETEIIESIGRLYSLARRIAKLQLD